MPLLSDLRKELRDLRKSNSPKPVSLMKKDDILMELERNRMLNKFIEQKKNEVESVDENVMEVPDEKKKTVSKKVPKIVEETVAKIYPKKKTTVVKPTKQQQNTIIEDEEVDMTM